MVSLNSATESPRATPTPQPAPTTAINTVKPGSAGASSKNPQNNNAKKVIQELKPVDSYPAATTAGAKSSIGK